MILIVYDPDIAVFAERCLHDGDTSAINSSIVSSGNKVILRHCLISKPYDKDPAEKDCDGVTGKENSCKPYEEESVTSRTPSLSVMEIPCTTPADVR